MKKKVVIPERVLLVLFILALVFSVVVIYISLYSNSASTYSTSSYKSVYGEAPSNAYVGVIVSNGSVEYDWQS